MPVIFGPAVSPDVQAALLSLGISPALAPGSEAHMALIRTARHLRGDARTVGLIPTTAAVGVAGVAIQLALALHEVGAVTVGIVDANSALPAFSDLARFGTAVRSEHPDGFVAVELGIGVKLLTPQRAHPGLPLQRLAAILPEVRAQFDKVLVDLTGFRELGEHRGACELLDGVLVLATANQTKEHELEALVGELAGKHLLGTLLVG